MRTQAWPRRVLIVVGGLVLLGGLWIAVTGYFAKQSASRIEDRLRLVRADIAVGNFDAARRVAADIPPIANRMHRLTTGPAWWVAAAIPYVGDPLEVMRGTTSAGKRISADGLDSLLSVADKIDPAKLRVHGDTIDIGVLAQAAPGLRAEATNLNGALALVDRLPKNTWFKQADDARATLVTQLRSVVGYVDAASNAANVLPTMLGANGPQRYFVGLQNEAEMRGTGGLPGAFAIVEVNKGRLKFTHFESDTALLPHASGLRIDTGLDFGSDYNGMFAPSEPTRLFVNSNISPHFPYAAQIWARMWQKVSGERIDGAVAVDPQVLAYLLAVTGPATLPNGLTVGADRIVALTERDEYAQFANNDERKAFLVAILKAASQKLTSGAGSALNLARALSVSAAQQRLLVWSADQKVESVLAHTSYGGAIPTTTQPFGAAVITNAAAGKLDYYLTRGLDYRRTGCGATRDVTVKIRLTNTAPESGLPAYVTTRLDKRDYPVQPGDNRTLLDYYATSGAELLSATLNGKPTTVGVEQSFGHPVFRADLELPRGTTQELVLHLIEPAGTARPTIWRQPGVTPLDVVFFDQTCR